MNDSKASYTIGTVARLTGLSTHVLRKWETRYGVPHPMRSDTGRRRYSAADLAKVRALATLVQRGHTISELASLSPEELTLMVDASSDSATGKGVRVAVSGPGLTALIAAQRDVFPAPLEFLVVAGDPLPSTVDSDMLLIERPSLSEALFNTLVKQRYGRVVVVYNFSNKGWLQRFEDSGMVCVKAPITAGQLLPHLRDVQPSYRPVSQNPPPPPRFSDASIATIANASTTIECECPLHIAQLLSSISAFERYSAECANRQPEDQALHAFLGQIAGHARAQFEVALARVAEAEGYVLNELSTA